MRVLWEHTTVPLFNWIKKWNNTFRKEIIKDMGPLQKYQVFLTTSQPLLYNTIFFQRLFEEGDPWS